MAVLLPTLLTMFLLVIDGSHLTSQTREAQHIVDTAALSGADELYFDAGVAKAEEVASHFALANLASSTSSVEVNCPPLSGRHAGSSHHVEVVVREEVRNYLGSTRLGTGTTSVSARAVAGLREATDDAAIVVLDDDPPPFALEPILPIVSSLPALIAGLEVLGLGRVEVDGAVLVNTDWGGVDEFNKPVGPHAGPPYSVACMPVLPTTKFLPTDLYVSGGVDRLKNYAKFGASQQQSVVQANRRPVPDPFRALPTPTTSVDAMNVHDDYYGGRTLVGLPLIGPPIKLRPGVYDWITILAGKVEFEPGVYIIRRRDPLTQISLTMLAGQVDAQGVMFYVTDSPHYSPNSGYPDRTDGEGRPESGLLGNVNSLLPSVVINIGLLSSHITPLDDPSSPFDGFTFYQRRGDRRPMVFVQENLLGRGSLEGTIYSKWGHVILAGKGEYDARFVVGTMRIVALLDVVIRPAVKLPPAYDVYLAE